MSDKFVAIGSRGNDYYGAVYIFMRNDNNDWLQQTKIIPNDEHQYNSFGCSVAIMGDYLIIGSGGNRNVNGDKAGAAYIYKYDQGHWVQEAKIIASDGAEYECFGSSVSIYNNYVIVGKNHNNTPGIDYGSAYIFKRNGNNWLQVSKIIASDVNSGDCFGGAVAISENYVLIGSSYDDVIADDSGSAYIYKSIPTISGYVKDNSDKPFINARIEFDKCGSVESQNDGYYSINICSSWSGKATISYNNYIFSPQQINIDPITKNLNQNFTISVFNISGFVKDIFNNPISGSEVVFNSKGGTTLTNSQGYYSKEIYHNWTGNAYVKGKGYKYEPVAQTYNNVDQRYSGQNYTGSKLTISGYCFDNDLLP
ncbi:MAG: hypothetical protein OMM_13931, partial [Candidatus Magnetoglobus multicellularis str. Araruama]